MKKNLVRRKKPTRSSSAPARKIRRVKPLTLVGIGASAGGMQAFKELLHHLPRKVDFALVLVQHLEPHHESILAEILTRETQLPVVQGRDRQRLLPGHVYIIPPNAYLSVAADRLRISPRTGGTRVPRRFLPIDFFLTSLARDKKSRAVAVILSGTGADGTQGAIAVRAAGGLTLAQDQASAAFPEMPASAVSAQAVDFVLTPKEIAAKLVEISRHPGAEAKPAAGAQHSAETQFLDQLFRLLHKTSGVDFSHYKYTTIQRRIKRRMAMHRQKTLKDYVAFLEVHPEELEPLSRDFLIPVTAFFRDRKYFEFLEKKIYPALLEAHGSSGLLRIWVPGCSTGEEAYSLAMSLSGYLASRRSKLALQIFGTDISETAIAKARSGQYSAAVTKDIPAALLRRFFTKTDQGYRIEKALRDLCLFSRHNVISDPPFSNIDLVSFRNALIYMDASLQGRIIPLLHFALKPGGYLMLGTSESISAHPALFGPVDKRYRIFQRKNVSPRERFSFTPSALPESRTEPGKASARPLDAFFPEKEVDRILIKKYVPAGVLVNGEYDILQFRGHTGAFLEPAAGRANLNLLGMAREGLWGDLRKTIDAARRQDAPVKRRAWVKNESGLHNLILDVTPLHPLHGRKHERYFFIAFELVLPLPKEKKRSAGNRRLLPGESKNAPRLQRENSELKEYLQSMRSEMENTSEELKAAQEEMQSSNEELQSMNEELETSKEELQSSNEELLTTNEELKNKNQDLIQFNNDLVNVLSGIDLPLVILDRHLHIRRFTAAAKRILNVLDSDLGRTISDIKLKMPIPALEDAVNDVIATARVRNLEIGDPRHGWFTLVIKPYITAESKIEGALLAFYDMTRIKESLVYSENIVATLREPVIVLNSELKVVSANRAFYDFFQVEAAETVGLPIYHLGCHQWNIPKLRELLESVIPSNSTVDEFLLTNQFPKIGTKTLLLNARRINPESGGTSYTLLAIEDITERHRQEMELKHTQNDLQDTNRRKDEFLAMLAHELRNPLSPIQTSLELIQSDPEGVTEKTAQRLDRIRRQVHHLSRIVNDLMDTSRISRGLVVLRKEPLNLDSVILQTLESFQTRLADKRQTLAVSGPGTVLTLEADPVRLVQILSNLLDNALKFTPECGNIELRARRLGNAAVIEVEDSGIGIPAEVLPQLFDLFYQKEKGSDRAQGGLGIGLTLARNLAELHGGTLEAQSDGQGRGATFILRLPLASAPTPGAVVRRQPASRARKPALGLKILVVEDQRVSAESLGELLHTWGHHVTLCYTGRSALQTAIELRPDLILLDIGLPDLNGYQVAKRLRENPALNRTVLAALTGYNPDASRLDHAIFAEYFTKPVETDKLAELLARLKPESQP